MNDYLNEWKNVTFAAMSGQIPTIMEAFEGAVDRAEQRSKLLNFCYRCSECQDRMDPDEDMVFVDGNLVFCVRHRPRWAKALFCAVKGCCESPVSVGTLCLEHQALYGIGALTFNEGGQ